MNSVSYEAIESDRLAKLADCWLPLDLFRTVLLDSSSVLGCKGSCCEDSEADCSLHCLQAGLG